MVDVEAAVDALPATERRHPAVARVEQRGRKRSRNAEATEPEEPTAISLRGVSRAEDISKLVPSKLQAGRESAKVSRPKSPQHVPGKYDDVGAAQLTAQSAAAGASNVPNSSTEHKETSDVSTFPITCTLEKHARGFYIVSGVCHLCDKTFRCAGSVYSGKVHRWNNFTCLHRRIIKHARTHGAVGYTAYRNLDKMRLDWIRSPDEASEVVDRENHTRFCAGCAKWRRTTQFRRGASTCNNCLQIACAACGNAKKQTQYRSQDVYNFLNRKINARCRTCRQKGSKRRVSTHKTHTGEHCRQRRCTKCGVYQVSSTYRRTKRGQRVDICRTCEVVPCAACGAMLTRENFTDPDIYRFFHSDGAKHITCLVCKKGQHVRQQWLQNLMKKSRRKACTCRHPQAHTKTCPLRIKFDGDRAYPGCDVMSRADSDWLREQWKKNGWVRAA